jgi:hypothetical protein
MGESNFCWLEITYKQTSKKVTEVVMEIAENSLLDLIQESTNKIPFVFRIFNAVNPSDIDIWLEELLEQAAQYLEANANNLYQDNENKISAFLVAYLNMPGILRATQEQHTNGHVDITIEGGLATPIFRRLGEAKIYDGYQYHIKGLNQLVNRYSTGREGTGFMFCYVKKDNIKGLIDDLRKEMDKVRPFRQTDKSEEHKIKWGFITTHLHDCGDVFRVVHINFNLFRKNNSN